MKRIFCLIMVFISVFVLASCSKKKSHDYKEQVSKEIKAEEGGTVESSDGKTSVEIPAGALEGDTKITMTIYDASGYSDENGKIVSKVVDFEPTGTIFKKPVIIKMATDEKVEKKTISAAVYDEKEEKWSYSQGFYLIIKDGKNEAGDPIMQTTDGKEVSLDNGNLTTAAGDPIMMTNAAGDPIMTNAAGDPIMMSAAGDPIMLASENAAGDPIMTSAAGDPIMTSAAGDPIMNSAAGDPIMMTTGHFTTFTFIVFDPRKEQPVEPVENDDDETVDDSNDEPVTENDDEINDETPDEIEDIDEDELPDEVEDIDEEVVVPARRPLCTGLSVCSDGEGNQILCPKEGEDFYGQDAQYAARGSCEHRSYTAIPRPEDDETEYYRVHDNTTGLTWLITEESVPYAEKDTACAGISYGDTAWRIPTPKEFLSIVDSGYLDGSAIDPLYFDSLYSNEESAFVWTEAAEIFYDPADGRIIVVPEEEGPVPDEMTGLLICVSGEKYGEVHSENYETLSVGNESVIHDKSTGLFWQKASVSGKSWRKALEYCENLNYAGYTDWRLPNKNELITLLDYSKTDEILSSFPGIQTEQLWSSTSKSLYSSGYLNLKTAWFVATDGNMWYNDIALPEPCAYEGCEYEEVEPDYGLNTRCVRSDLGEKEETPECDGSGIGPCRDASSGIVWSSRLYPQILYPPVYTGDDYGEGYGGSGYGYGGVFFAAVMCRDLNENGSNKWRIPTLDELRTIVTDEDLNEAEPCGYYESSYCVSNEPSKTALNDFGLLVSGSMQGEGSDWPMFYALDVKNGNIPNIWDPPLSELVIRCVRDDALNFEKAPYTDPDTGYRWSEKSEVVLTLEEARDFCSSMNLDDSQHYWRLPDDSELESLNKIDKGSCTKYGSSGNYCYSGEYSLFGDIEEFWAANDTYINFWDLAVYAQPADGLFKARCVSNSQSPCKNNTCASVEHSDGTCIPLSESEYACGCNPGYEWDDGECFLRECSPETGDAVCIDPEHLLIWSSLATEKKDWSDAGTYCENLEEDGYTDWKLPTIDELRTLIQNCEQTQFEGACLVSDPDYLDSDYNDGNCACDQGMLGGYYSMLGDDNNINLWSSSVSIETDGTDKAWLVGFWQAAVTNSDKGDSNHVRCVRSN